MVAPYPREAIAGRPDLKPVAEFLFKNFGWLARLSDELNDDTQLNAKKLNQFIQMCLSYRETLDRLRDIGGARVTVEAVFRDHDVEWTTRAAMVADLQAIYVAAGLEVDWLKANMLSAIRSVSTNEIDDKGNTTEVVKILDKSPEFAARIASFRSLYGAKE